MVGEASGSGGVGDGLSAFWDRSADGGLLLDAAASVLAVNRAAAGMLGREAEDLVGAPVGEVLGPALSRAAAGRRPAELEVDVEVVDESWSYLARVMPLDGPAGGSLVLLTDLAGERHADTERARSLRSEAAKTRTLRLVAHDLGGPLTVVLGYMSMLAEGSISLSRMREVTPILLDNARQMRDLVDLLLDAARLEDGRLELERSVVRLDELLRSTVSRLPPWTRERSVEIEVRDSELDVEVDPTRITSVIRNLVVNALKYSPETSEVRCVCRRQDDLAIVEVVDHGRGIDAAGMRRLFTRFGRLAPTRGSGPAGIGLGLHLGRQLARLHGGDLVATSEPGTGSTFRLLLPALAAPRGNVTGASAGPGRA